MWNEQLFFSYDWKNLYFSRFLTSPSHEVVQLDVLLSPLNLDPALEECYVILGRTDGSTAVRTPAMPLAVLMKWCSLDIANDRTGGVGTEPALGLPPRSARRRPRTGPAAWHRACASPRPRGGAGRASLPGRRQVPFRDRRAPGIGFIDQPRTGRSQI